ncbi:MAG: hypothetical protein AAF355_01940 [Myxococcota bacterium]
MQWKNTLNQELFIIENLFCALVKVWNTVLDRCECKNDISHQPIDAVAGHFDKRYESVQVLIKDLETCNNDLYQVSSDLTLLESKLKGRIEAVTAIQTRYRGRTARATVLPELDKHRARLSQEAKQNYRPNAATRIQALWRGHAAQMRFLRSDAATTIQRWWRQQPHTSLTRSSSTQSVQRVHRRLELRRTT